MTSYICVCPVEQVTYVTAGTKFNGCPGSAPSTPCTAEEIIANVDPDCLEAFVVNGVPEVLGAAIVTVNGKTFTVFITSAIPVADLTAQLELQIALFLGGDYTADNVDIEYTGKKRATTGQVLVTLTEPALSGTATYSFLIALFIGFLAILI